MTLASSFHLAVGALRRHRLRTALTLVGLVIGVAAVITMVALGEGAQGSVDQELRQAGTNLIAVDAGNYTRGGESVNLPPGLGAATTLTPHDAGAIAALPGVRRSSGRVHERAHVEAAGTTHFTRVLGVSADWAAMYSWQFAGGEAFTAHDVDAVVPVAVLGARTASRLFADPTRVIGEKVILWHTPFRVAGVLAPRRDDQHDAVFLPVTTMQQMIGISHLHGVTVEAENAGDTSVLAREIRRRLRQRHGLDRPGAALPEGPSAAWAAPDDFEIKSQAAAALTKGLYTTAAVFALANLPDLDRITLQEMTGTLTRANQTLTALLSAIAGVSLVVGGIGIMNVMLVTVTERTREIGLRMAAGARPRDVLQQFLAEAVTVSLAGGVIGILLGSAVAVTLTQTFGWDASLSPVVVAWGFGLSALVGVIFGYYPARRAAAIDPIQALRHE